MSGLSMERAELTRCRSNLFRVGDCGKSVARISIGDETATGFYCRLDSDGCLIDCLITNHHVLENPASASAACVDFMCLTEEDIVCPSRRVALQPQRLFWTSPTVREGGLDVTIVAIRSGDVELQPPLIPLQFDPVPVEIPARFMVTLYGHPDGEPLTQSSENVTNIIEENNQIQYASGTAHGSSGSPVFHNETGLVIGIHHKRIVKIRSKFKKKSFFQIHIHFVPLIRI